MEPESEEKHLSKKEKRLLKKQQKMDEYKVQEKGKLLNTLIRWGVGIAIVIGIFIYLKNLSSVPATTLPLPELTKVSTIDHVTGASESAKLLVEYSDFQCPACAAYQPLLKQLLTQHEKDI